MDSGGWTLQGACERESGVDYYQGNPGSSALLRSFSSNWIRVWYFPCLRDMQLTLLCQN
ncbi:hypothetical protein LINPERHAP2_LOCUS35548 [Linum perenne]